MRNTLIILLLLFASCYENKTCQPYYVGIFEIDTSLMVGLTQKEFVLNHKWDTAKLISNEKGIYFFNISDKILKQSEGIWYSKSNDIEGNCFGYIKQNNLNEAFIRSPFDIMVIVDDTTRFTLPFRKK